MYLNLSLVNNQEGSFVIHNIDYNYKVRKI